MVIEETSLPGVGKKHVIDLGDKERLVIITHNTGRREVFHKQTPDADATKLFSVSDQQARTIGTILEGAYFQPVASDTTETQLGPGQYFEWFEIPPNSPLETGAISPADAEAKTSAVIVAIRRGASIISTTGSEATIEEGDTVVIIGSRESIEAFAEIVEPRSDP